MKRLAFLAVVACLFSCTMAGTGLADTITFDSLNIFPVTGSHTEGAFTYTVVSGVEWQISNSVGNPPSALTFNQGPNAGDEIDFVLTGGGLFTFDSFDVASLVVGHGELYRASRRGNDARVERGRFFNRQLANRGVGLHRAH